MENASKALIIAGAVLLSMMIVSLGVMIFNNMSNSVKNDSSLQREEIASFNSKINPYLGNNKSGSQVKALIQLVRSIDQNAINTEDTVRKVSISFNGNNVVSIESNKIKEDRATANSIVTNEYYKVEGTYDSNGLITTIKVSNSGSSGNGSGNNQNQPTSASPRIGPTVETGPVESTI